MRKIFSSFQFFLLVVSVASAGPPATIQFSLVREEDPNSHVQYVALPYCFSSESMGFTYGAGGIVKGWPQKQLLLGGTAFASVDGAKGVLGGIWDLKLPCTDRMYFTAFGSYGQYPRQRAFVENPFSPEGTIAGSNGSDKDDYVEARGDNNWLDLRLEYMLPLGMARSRPVINYKTRGGLLVSDPTCAGPWNPVKSGVSVLVLRQLNEYRSYEGTNEAMDRIIHPVELGILYDNTDFSVNPSYGSRQYLGYMQNFNAGNSDKDWSFMSLEYSKFFDLGASDWARQRVIALDLWTGTSPTWEQETDADGQVTLDGNPPFFQGANLGGYFRMRGYPQYRFHDRSVMYTAAEYRYTLQWNPLKNVRWLDFLKVDWLQTVAFVEGGRVAEEYGDLFGNWKADAGIGLRAMIAGGILRFDIGFSDESTAGWLMVGQPF